MKWSSRQAARVQEELAAKVIIKGSAKKLRYVAGLDVAYCPDDELAFGAAVVFDMKRLKPMEIARATARPGLPYIPGFLSFREAPVLVKAMEKLKNKPEAIICDGQGIAHPRRMGIAAHMGVALDLPAVGCAKSRLVGEYKEPGMKRGRMSPLIYNGMKVGMVVRSRDKVRPVFVSPGHRLGIMPAARLALCCCLKYRIPEPVRLAHQEAKRMQKEA